MSESRTHNGQIPTDPTQLAALLLIAAAVIGQLTPEQADTLSNTIGFAGALLPFLPRGGR